MIGGSQTFNSSNWDDERTITIRASDDDNGVPETAAISFAITGGDYDSETEPDIPVKILDDDTPDLTITPLSLTDVDEGSTTGKTYTIKPTTEPSAEFTVNLSSDNDVVEVSPEEITFNAGNWQTAQTVRVTALQDDDAFDDTATITHTTAMTEGDHLEYHQLTGLDSVSVTADDDDEPEANASLTSLTVNEGSNSTYTITLDTLPVDANGESSSVTVAIAQKSGTENSDISQTSSVTLDQNNWDTGATVTVSAINDPDTTRETTTLEHTVTGADYGGETVGDVMVTVNDDDSVGVTISEPSLTPTEGSNATYTVVLNTQPTGTVTVTATSGNSDVTLSTASDTNLSAVSLEFTSTTWNTAQTVTVAAAEDADAAVDSATITHAVSGAEYATAPIPAPINVTVTENDVLDIDVMPLTLGIDEVDGGTGTDTYTVELKAAPTGGSVTIQINVTGDDNVTTTRSSLTFSASEWTTPTTASVSKTVTVNVSDDPDATSPETATIEHPVSGSSDYATRGIAADDVVVTVTDTDTRGVTLSSMDVTVAEGSTNTYTLVLGTQPTGDVLVTIIDPTDNDVIETDPASLTFTADNWNSPQTVTVRALPDDDANDDTGTVTHGVSGADYTQTPAITVDDVMVTSTDGDTRGVEIVVTADPYPDGRRRDDHLPNPPADGAERRGYDHAEVYER